jgi:hypothetical protein
MLSLLLSTVADNYHHAARLCHDETAHGSLPHATGMAPCPVPTSDNCCELLHQMNQTVIIAKAQKTVVREDLSTPPHALLAGVFVLLPTMGQRIAVWQQTAEPLSVGTPIPLTLRGPPARV